MDAGQTAQSIRAIRAITTTVQDHRKLASQTSLLSINASIEAARVGEVGRGFGVVATEVKKLATQAATASTEIQQRVRDLMTATSHTSTTIEQIWNVIRGEKAASKKAA